MSYQSFTFLIFTGIVLLAYYLIKPRYQKYVLALANLVFYALNGAKYLPFLAVTMGATFLAGKKIGSIYQKADEKLKTAADSAEKKEIRQLSKKHAKRVLLMGMAIALGLLVVCKYALFLVENVNGVLTLFGSGQIPLFRMILPVGISFYTFMAISYVLDVYWKRYKAEKSFLTYAVYLSYFPHIVQGPIDRFGEFRDQLKEPVSFCYQNLTFGAQLMLWGFFKKLVVANILGLFVDQAFANYETFAGFVMIFAIVAYSIQIYADFSGCIDIVSGVSEMLGIRMRRNFNHPYFSKTMAEFWRRWHISLQEWFKDYVYYPVSLGGLSKKGKSFFAGRGMKRASSLFASCFPVLVVWLITGIWHGAAWKFVAWGLFHAALLIGSQVFEPVFERVNRALHIKTDSKFWKLWQMARTFFLCCVGRVFFRADSIGESFGVFARMLKPAFSVNALLNPPVGYGVDIAKVIVGVVSVLVLLTADIMEEKMHVRKWLSERPIAVRWAILFAGIFAVIIFGVYGPGAGAGSFIYEQF